MLLQPDVGWHSSDHLIYSRSNLIFRNCVHLRHDDVCVIFHFGLSWNPAASLFEHEFCVKFLAVYRDPVLPSRSIIARPNFPGISSIVRRKLQHKSSIGFDVQACVQALFCQPSCSRILQMLQNNLGNMMHVNREKRRFILLLRGLIRDVSQLDSGSSSQKLAMASRERQRLSGKGFEKKRTHDDTKTAKINQGCRQVACKSTDNAIACILLAQMRERGCTSSTTTTILSALSFFE